MKKILCAFFIFISCFAFSKVDASNLFYDTRGTKYEGVVERMSKLGIINGVSETTFAPNRSITRAELAKIIVKMKGIDDYATDVEYKKYFSDVENTDWFYPYVMIASELELVNGYSDGTFRPNKEVSYAETVAILLRYLGYTRLKEDSPNGWYWNYIVKMREIELNDNIGEFDYLKPANRGDVTMFAWNALITDSWAIINENDTTGFTYTYSEKTPFEVLFKDYGFIDNENINAVVGLYNNITIWIESGLAFTAEKLPLYALGGRITAVYNKDDGKLFGMTLDEDYEDCQIVSGPIFYLKEQGYKLNSAKKSVHFGNYFWPEDESTYAYLVMNKDKTEILRTVYIDAFDSGIVKEISINEESGDDDVLPIIKLIKLNDVEFTSAESAIWEKGERKDWSEIKKGDVLTNLGLGLFAYTDAKKTAIVTDIKARDRIWLDGEKYVVCENCEYITYGEKEYSEYKTLGSKKANELIGVEATVYFNIAEEVCKIEFGKTKEDNEKYLLGYVVDTDFNEKLGEETVFVQHGENQKSKFVFKTDKSIFKIGNFVAIYEEEEETKYTIIESKVTFDNELTLEYAYDSKVINYPMMGELMITDETKYYKVTLKYKDNSISQIETCKVENFDINNKNVYDLSAYQLNILYDENMDILKVFAINETNKFGNQVALVKETKMIEKENDSIEYKITLSITDLYKTIFGISKTDFSRCESGDLITFIFNESDKGNTIALDETFRKEFIGYKRDLIVKEFNDDDNKVIFNDNSIMDLDEDIYTLNNNKINLNKYRFVYTTVSNQSGEWKFYSANMVEKENLDLKVGDRFAIGEIDNIIVIYSGYEE